MTSPKKPTRAAACTRSQPKAHAVGRWGEDLAARILETNGYRLLDRNWRLPAGYEGERAHGEIDAIAIDPDDELVFIEIKTRTDSGFGHPWKPSVKTRHAAPVSLPSSGAASARPWTSGTSA